MISPLDNHLLRAYLDGEMDEAATQAFEIRLIERPELAELVDADSALGIGLRAADAPAKAPAATVVALPTAAPAPPARRVARVVPFLAAAAVLLGVGVGAGRLLQPAAVAPAALVPATVVSVDSYRSSPPVLVELSLPASGSVILQVPTIERTCLLHVEVHQGNVVLATDAKPDESGPLDGADRPDEVGELRYAILIADASRLSPGRAVITIGCVGGEPTTYTVEFVR